MNKFCLNIKRELINRQNDIVQDMKTDKNKLNVNLNNNSSNFKLEGL